MDKKRLLAEVEDLLRTMPPQGTLDQQEPLQLEWLGRAASVLSKWEPIQGSIALSTHALHTPNAITSQRGESEILMLIYQARHSLRMETGSPQATVLGSGATFDYFDELRKIIEQATGDILFVDPYMEAEFVARYLPHVKRGVTIRLLGREKMATLLPAVKLFAQQHTAHIEVRSDASLHDRFVFIDKRTCYSSGASFKDGATKSPVVLAPMMDAFPALSATYEGLWTNGKVET